MKSFASALVLVLAAGESTFAQQTVPPAPAAEKAVQTAPATPASTDVPPAATVAPSPNTLLDGTAVKLKLDETISSEHEKTGQQIPFTVVDDVSVMGVVVIPKGSPALATVTNAEPKKRMGRGGKLDVNVDSARLVDGEKVQLRAVQENKGGGHIGAMTGAMVATSIVFFPAAPLFLFMHGKEVTIPEGTVVTAFVQGDMKLDMAKMAPAAAPGDAPASGAALAAATPVTSSLTVESSVTGADIEIDGAFVGSTPSTLSVTPGQHTITVKKKGYMDWSRTMNVSGSAVKVNADLETTP